MVQVVAVYPDRETADAVAVELHDRVGVPDAQLRVADAEDARLSVEAEMDAENEAGWGSGLFGFVTSEMARGALVFGSLGAAAGTVLGLPLGALLYDSSVSALTRLGVGALVGALFGWIVGALLGGGMAVKDPGEGLAAERGVPVAVDDRAADLEIERLERVMTDYGPIRIDRIVEGRRVETPAAEGPGGVRESVNELVAGARDPSRR